MAIWGHPGTNSSVVIRLARLIFLALSVALMIPNPMMIEYIVYKGLFAAIAISSLWTSGLCYFDIYALKHPWVVPNRTQLTVFVVGEFIVAFLTFATATGSAGIALVFSRDTRLCTYLAPYVCRLTASSIATTLIASFFTIIQSMVILWRLAKS